MQGVAQSRIAHPAWSATALGAVVLGGLFLALVHLSWVGFIGSDDAIYADGAYGWLREFPYVGGHGSIRYTITIPTALAFALLGEGEFALVLPTLLYAVALVVAIYFALVRFAGMENAVAALGAVVTSPLLVIAASIAGIDIIEALFLFLSVFLYCDCVIAGPTLRKLFAAGALAGLGYLTRETSIFIAVFYGILFLAGYGFERRYYWMIAAGFLAVWGLEVAYLTAMTGDPLYRMNISLHHDSVDRSVDLAGNVLVHPAIDPLLVLLFNQEFAFLYWIGVPLSLWLCFRAPLGAAERRFCKLLGLFGLVWFVTVAAATSLLPLNPRYFLPTTVVTSVLTGIALIRMWRVTRARTLALALAVLLLVGNLAGIHIENKDYMFGERMLVEAAGAARGRAVHTDPLTRHRAEFLLKWQGLGAKVAEGPPRPGSLYLLNRLRAADARAGMRPGVADLYTPKPTWRVEREAAPSPPLLGVVLDRLGLAPLVPGKIWNKLRQSHPGVVLYRLPAA